MYEAGVRLGLVQNELSIQWQEEYAAPGEVKCLVQHTAENTRLLKVGNRLYNTDFDTVALIEEVILEKKGGEATLCVRAKCTAALLDQRVLMASEPVGNVEAAMYNVYKQNRRGLLIVPAEPQGYGNTSESELCWGSVLDAEKQLATTVGFGFRVVFDPEDCSETFTVYRGVRRCAGDSGYVGYFGDDVGNIVSYSFGESVAGIKNVAVVAGQEEDDGSREVVITSLYDVQGEERRELYVDARSLRRKYQKAQDTGQRDAHGNPVYSYTVATHTAAKYRAALGAKGQEALTKLAGPLRVSCEVTGEPLQFGRDFNLGDVMPVKLGAAGALLRARVVAVRRVYEPAGLKTLITLSEFELEEA